MAENSFEDAFTDIQTGLVSLVLEALEGMPNISRVYIFGAIEQGMTSFNACVCVEGRIERLDAVVSNRNILLHSTAPSVTQRAISLAIESGCAENIESTCAFSDTFDKAPFLYVGS